MEKIKPYLYFFAAFALFNAIIINAYNYSILELFNLNVVELTYKHIPVFKGAVFLTFMIPVTLVLSFFLSKGDSKNYDVTILGLSFFPPIGVTFILPGQEATPDIFYLKWQYIYWPSVIVHFCASKLMSGFVWEIGGRKMKKKA